VADRVVLSLDQGASAHQALLRHEPQRGEDANLDRGGGLPDGGDPPQGTRTAGHVAQNFATFERSSV